MAKRRLAKLSTPWAAALTVAVSAVLFIAVGVALARVNTPQQGTTAPGAHEFRILDNITSCSRCHDGTFPHYQHGGQVCSDCHGGGHVATAATCVDCHGAHDEPLPLNICTQCHTDVAGQLLTEPIPHDTAVDPIYCSVCHPGGVPGAPLAPTTTLAPTVPPTLPPTTTLAPTTTVAPTTTLPPSTTLTPTTTVVPTTTAAPPTTTVAPTTTTTAPPVNQPPVAVAGPDMTLQVSELGVFNGLGSTDPEGQLVSYLWDFGDGTQSATSVIAHSYPVAGTYTATLTVTDAGGLSDSDTLIVTVVQP